MAAVFIICAGFGGGVGAQIRDDGMIGWMIRYRVMQVACRIRAVEGAYGKMGAAAADIGG